MYICICIYVDAYVCVHVYVYVYVHVCVYVYAHLMTYSSRPFDIRPTTHPSALVLTHTCVRVWGVCEGGGRAGDTYTQTQNKNHDTNTHATQIQTHTHTHTHTHLLESKQSQSHLRRQTRAAACFTLPRSLAARRCHIRRHRPIAPLSPFLPLGTVGVCGRQHPRLVGWAVLSFARERRVHFQ